MAQQDIVMPRPQKIMCEKKKTLEATHVAIYQKDAIFVSNQQLDDLRLRDQDLIGYFLIQNTFNDWKNVYQFFQNDYCSNLNYYSKYIMEQNFNPSLQDSLQQFYEKVEQLKENLMDQIDQMKQDVENQIIKLHKYFQEKVMTYKDPEIKIKTEYDAFKKCLSEYKNGDQESFKNLKSSLQQFVKKITQTENYENFKDDKIVTKVDELRRNQPVYANKNIWDVYQSQIEKSITDLKESYISANSFNQTKIADKGYIFEVLQQIKQIYNFDHEQKKHELTEKLIPLFQCPNNKIRENILKFKDDLKTNVVLALMRTSTDQSIGFYSNANRKGDSLLFSLTKNVIFTGLPSCELKLAQNDKDSTLLWFGKDLVMTNDFKKCKSELGEVFNLTGKQIGNPRSYLANGQYFDIEYFELYRIDDPDLLKESIQQPQQSQKNSQFNFSQFGDARITQTGQSGMQGISNMQYISGMQSKQVIPGSGQFAPVLQKQN